MGTERGQSSEESKKTSTQHVIMVPGTFIIPSTTAAVCSKERTAQHDTAPQDEGQGTAPHYAALRC